MTMPEQDVWLDSVVDDAVSVLLLRQPTWVRCFDPRDLPAHVRGIITEAEADARRLAKEHGTACSAGSGGLMVEYDPDDGSTTVTAYLRAKWDDDSQDSGL